MTSPLPIRIDFAVVNNQVDTQLVVQDDLLQYVINLDVIDISENIFKSIFFNSNSFYVNPLANSDATLSSYISFCPSLRTMNNGKEFCLTGEIIGNYCKDAGIPSDSFTPCSLIGLNKQISAIKTLYNVYQNRNAVHSLNWDELIQTVSSAIDGEPEPTSGEAILTFTASFIPASSNSINFLPTIVKFNYRVTLTF